MALTTEEAARLASLQTAYDKVIAGDKATAVSSGGRRVEYGPADDVKLKCAIDELNAKAASGCRRTRGAIGFRIT